MRTDHLRPALSVATALCASVFGSAALAEPTAAEQEMNLVVGPQAGASINSDQWLVGGFFRLGGVCFFICGGDWGLGLHGLGGIGGNHLTFRVELRLDRIFWFGDPGTVGLYLATGLTGQGSVPVGGFGAFCDRTELVGCGGVRVGYALGAGLRLGPGFLEGQLLTGELPALAVTAGAHFSMWPYP